MTGGVGSNKMADGLRVLKYSVTDASFFSVYSFLFVDPLTAYPVAYVGCTSGSKPLDALDLLLES